MMRRVVLAVGIAFALGCVATMALGQESTDDRALVSSLNECIREENHLSVLFLMDESRSLASTDPEGNRAIAARAGLAGLGLLAEPPPGSQRVEVEVMIAGFGSEYVEYSRSEDHPDGFVPLRADRLRELDEELAGFANRLGAQDTDYVRGLLGAAGALADRGPCRLLVWFTDGRYDIESDVSRPEYDERAGTTTDRGPDDYEAIGREWLCGGPGSIADLLRGERVHVLTAALAVEPEDERFFTQRITEGTDGGGGVCGTRLPEAARLGVFVNSAAAVDLIFDLDVLCPECPTPTGSRTFELVFPVTQVRIVAVTQTPDFRVTLEPPRGSAREVALDEVEFEVAGVDGSATWFSSQVFVFVLRPRPEERSS